jgi:L-fuculokinase
MIAIFDIGKTNKKLSVLDNNYNFVFENAVQIPDIKDEDGENCDDLSAIITWIKNSFNQLLQNNAYDIRALNFSAFGASIVYIDFYGNPAAPLYSYLKVFPDSLHKKFYGDYGGEQELAKVTASPVLGSLNSGLQIYRMKQLQPEKYSNIQYALHVPQFLSFIFTGKAYSDKTSIGCHTHLWDFTKARYHDWVEREDILAKLAPVEASEKTHQLVIENKVVETGIGLHDSSAALIPYLTCCTEPFMLISTGTWCITLNPFNQSPLTNKELEQDCLCYLTHTGKAVKSSRLFAGHWHETEVKRLAEYFHISAGAYKNIAYNKLLLKDHPLNKSVNVPADLSRLKFSDADLSGFNSYEEAYHALIADIVQMQVYSSGLVLNGSDVKNIYVDGGFSNNPIYMHLLAAAYPAYNVFAASVPQASTIGAAMVIHHKWNPDAIPADIIRLAPYHPLQ